MNPGCLGPYNMGEWCYDEDTRAAEDKPRPPPGGMALSAERWSQWRESGVWVWLLLGGRAVQGATHCGEGIVQVVDGPRDDDNVVDVQPERQHSSGQAHTWDQTHHHDLHLIQ